MSAKNHNSSPQGRNNLIFANLISIPGPVLLAFGMTEGTSTTQIADLIRRSCEFLTIFLAWVVYELTASRFSEKEALKRRLEAFIHHFTGLSMCLSGGIMVYLAVANFGGEKGDVTISLILALIGSVVNARLYLSYRTMDHAVLSVQAKLHRVKMLLDCALAGILFIWILSPEDSVKHYADVMGTGCISIYLTVSGLRMLKGRKVSQ